MMMLNEEVAMIVSTDAAVIFQNLVFWIEKSMANEKNFHDGEYWTYNSATAFEKLFVWMSKRKIERVLVELREADLIRTGNYNDHKYDRTTWYSLTEYGKSFSAFCRKHTTDLSHGNSKIVAPIPDSNTDKKHISTDKQVVEKEKALRPRRVTKVYGEHLNVKLTDDEYAKLQDKWPDLEKKINFFSTEKEIHGYKYTNDYLAILKWRFVEQPQFKQPEPPKTIYNDGRKWI